MKTKKTKKKLKNKLKKKSSKTCGSCQFLNIPYARHGEILPCSARSITVKSGFQQPESPICDFYEQKLTSLYSPDSEDFTEAFSDLTAQDFQLEKDIQTTIQAYIEWLKHENADAVSFDGERMATDIRKVAKIRFVRTLVQILGLGDYEHLFMAGEIARLYGLTISSFPPSTLSPNLNCPPTAVITKKKKQLKD